MHTAQGIVVGALVEGDQQGSVVQRKCTLGRAWRRRSWSTAAALCAALPTAAQASLLRTTVRVLPPLAGGAPDVDLLERAATAAAQAWGQWLDPAPQASLDLLVQFGPVTTATGNSLVSSFVGMDGAVQVFEQGAMAELRTGVDPNGPEPDGLIVLDQRYALEDLWFDPDPWRRQTPVPTERVDAVSVLLHEIAHILGFNGWRDPWTGALTGDFLSTFDQRLAWDGAQLTFDGPRTRLVFGGPVPLTPGAHGHLGALGDARFEDDLMNGTALRRGVRYEISLLDAAMLADVGAPMRADVVPGPSPALLFGLGGAAAARRRRR